MDARREQIFVGIFVIAAAVLLVVTVFSLSGALASPTRIFHAKFHNVAGLEPGASVRYEGGPKVGRVEKIKIDPADSSLMDMEFSLKNDIPVKTDSRVAILSFSPLGDNHLEVRAGSAAAQRAPDGSVLPTDPYVGFNDITGQLNDIAPQAKQLLTNLNDRVTQLKTTIDRVNDLVNDRNRENVSASLAQLHGMLAENRPVIQNALKNVNAASEKIGPLLDRLQKTTDQADGTLKKVDGMISENREDVRASVIKLRASLDNVQQLTAQMQELLDNNDYNIEELLNNMRIVSQNLKEFTDSLRRHPAELINPKTRRDRKPGDSQ
jgi:phospholipid/cholesterol/gamma-HCH transport system substrate-binding protein